MAKKKGAKITKDEKKNENEKNMLDWMKEIWAAPPVNSISPFSKTAKVEAS